MSDRPTFLFVCEEGDSSCAYYRATIPIMGLRNLGFPADQCSTVMQLDDGRWTGIVVKNGQRYRIDPPPDVLIVRRVNLPDGTIARTNWSSAILAGQKVFVDVDDDSWNLPEHNPAFGTMTDAELQGWSDDMATASGVIASTPALARSVQANTDAPVWVCRNGIDARIYRARNWKHDRPILRLGWCGTTDYRGRDLQMIVPALREALSRHRTDVEFWHLGGREESNYLLPIGAILGEKFPCRVRVWPWVPITQLPYSLAQIDCAVVPMEPGPFNEARSNVTGLALMAAGVPFIASQTEEYARLGAPTIQANVRGLDGEDQSHKQWVANIKTMIDGKPGRRWRIHWRAHGQRQLAAHSPEDTACQYLALVGIDPEGLTQPESIDAL